MSSPDMPVEGEYRFRIRLAVEEVVENIVRYAYEDSMGWMEVETHWDSDHIVLSITFKDAGHPFNPLETPDPDITLPVEERAVGGLGIFLCKQLMDKVEYRYEAGCNILTMQKIISNAS